MEFRVGVGEWNCRFFVSKFLTRIPRARSASPRSGCPSRGEAQRHRDTEGFKLPSAGDRGAGGLPPVLKISVPLSLCVKYSSVGVRSQNAAGTGPAKPLKNGPFVGPVPKSSTGEAAVIPVGGVDGARLMIAQIAIERRLLH